MLERDKAMMAKAFQIDDNTNINYIIFIATHIYGTRINNLDIKLVIQWDLPLSLDSMIQ